MSHPISEYDVFLSFRGEDTRKKFATYLYEGLSRKQIKTFMDNYELERGVEISPSLIQAIEKSEIYVIILSEHYAASHWCLDELTKILEFKETYGRQVIPVFYEVDPSDVRNQRKSYEEDFLKHHQHRSKNKIDAWKDALTQVGKLSGWDSQNFSPESILVEKIAEDILKKLNRPVSSNYYEGMTGMDKHIKQIQSLMQLESPTIRMIGIWGMGGIGKTTIASAVFEKLATQFSSKSIIRNFQQEIESAGLSRVKKEYLSQLLNEKITSSESNSYNQKLKRTKGLVVFDDVKDADQLKALIGTHHKFGQGTRIIVTSRDRQVLENANVDEIYEVEGMNDQDSLRLFCSFAFQQNHPKESYVSLIEKVLDYANGVPLALKVLGSLLYGKSKEEWESQLLKLEKLPEDDIFTVLKLSYDELDYNQRDIFLDIACFHRGQFVKVVEQTLDCFGFFTRIGMKVLEDRCLISISKGKVWMHDLIEEMGQRIVELQNLNPGKRSRLWKFDDIYDVSKMNKGKGTDAIQCIFLHMKERKDVQLHAETFKKMHNLRMINIHSFWNNKWTFRGFLKSFPNGLKFLRWDYFPQKYLPQDFCPENLVILYMPESELEQLWEGDQALPNLKKLRLSRSRKLKRLPDLSLCSNIEEVILSGCDSLTEVYSSNFLDKLNWLCLDDCTKLERLDIRSNILWRSSGLVALHGCHKLQTLLISSRTNVVQSDSWPPLYEAITIFDEDMDLCGDFEEDYWIVKFNPYIFTRINEFCWLDVSYCRSLTCLPAELLNLKILTRLCLRGCLKLEELPEFKETMENLKVLILDKTSITELPSSLLYLVGLEELSLQSCTKLKNIPSSIGNLSTLLKLNLADCRSLETFPGSIFKLKLTELDFKGCSMLRTFPEILEPAESFTRINLTRTAIKELPPSLHLLVGLEELSLGGCTKLKTIPSSIVNLSKLLKLDVKYCSSLETFPSSIFKLKLTELDFRGCPMLRTFPEIPNDSVCLSSLTKLSLQGSSIVNLPESMAHLSSLRSLNLSDCELLECVPKLPPNLNQVLACDCPSIKRMMLNSSSASEEGTFEFLLTNSQELDATCMSNIEEEAYTKIKDDAYRSVLFCFPGSAIPDWFPHRCQGHSISIRSDDLYGGNKLIGFALCVVLGSDGGIPWYNCIGFTYELKFEPGHGRTHFQPNKFEVKYDWMRMRSFAQDHTFLWKFDLTRIDYGLIDSHTITFQILDKDHGPLSIPTIMTVKECGIYPLYTKENDDNSIEESSRDAVCLVGSSSSGNYTK